MFDNQIDVQKSSKNIYGYVKCDCQVWKIGDTFQTLNESET